MDRQWAIERVQAYVDDLGEYERVWSTIGSTGSTRGGHPGHENGLAVQLDTILKIAAEAQPGVLNGLRTRNGNGFPYASAEMAARILLGALKDAEEVERHLGPQGPQLAASSMHPLVWGAAASLWDDGYRREAIQAASAVIFDRYLPAKLGVPKGTKPQDLASAFSTSDPEPEHPRLRLPGYVKDDDDWKSAHNGAQAIGRGCAMALRNLWTHTTEQPQEQEALEALATLSLFCRWAHDATVERVQEPLAEQAR